MPQYVVKIGEDRYLEWSTVVDAPISHGMSRDEMKQHLASQERVEEDLALEQAERRLRRADETGTSSMDRTQTPETMMAYNRAGPRETRLSVEELIQRYRQYPEDPPVP